MVSQCPRSGLLARNNFRLARHTGVGVGIALISLGVSHDTRRPTPVSRLRSSTPHGRERRYSGVRVHSAINAIAAPLLGAFIAAVQVRVPKCPVNYQNDSPATNEKRGSGRIAGQAHEG
jgi:hypothetical protein